MKRISTKKCHRWQHAAAGEGVEISPKQIMTTIETRGVIAQLRVNNITSDLHIWYIIDGVT